MTQVDRSIGKKWTQAPTLYASRLTGAAVKVKPNGYGRFGTITLYLGDTVEVDGVTTNIGYSIKNPSVIGSTTDLNGAFTTR